MPNRLGPSGSTAAQCPTARDRTVAEGEDGGEGTAGKDIALESEAVRAEIDNLNRSPKRFGSLRDPEQRDADRHVGYAYRLLEAYGAQF